MSENLKRLVVAAFEEPGWDYGTIRGPYSSFHVANGARFCVYNNRLMPVSQKIGRFEGYWALRQRAGLFDTGERPIEIAGADAEKLCNRLFTRDISKLRPGRAGYGLLCYPHGGILCDGVLMRLAADRFWYVQADGLVFSWLVAHAQGLDVTVSDPISWVTQIQGPASLCILERLCDGGAPADFKYFAVASGSIGGQPVMLSRTGWTNEMGFEVYTLPNGGRFDGAAMWKNFLAAGEPHGMEICALDSMDIRRIEAGILNNGSDMDETMTPYEAGLGAFVDLAKPDFIGKAALAKAPTAARLIGLRCGGGEPLREGAVTVDGRKLGFVTAGAWSPFLKQGVAIARLERAMAPGARVHVVCRDGNAHDADLAAFPFYDPEGRIQRGQDTSIPVNDAAK